MDPTNAELYKLVMPDAPYVIAALYVSLVLMRLTRLEKEMRVIEESCSRKETAPAE
jgi:hypothetical protein